MQDIRGAVIFAANHTSELDPILLPAAMPFLSRFLPMFYVSREKTFYNTDQILKRIFYGGLFFELWGAHKTHVGLNNYEVSLKTHVEILRRGNSLFILPEGVKSISGKLSEARGGAAFLSHNTGAPIVPVAITGVFKTTLTDFFTFKKNFTLTFGKPIYPIELLAGKTTVEPYEYKLAMNKAVMPRIAKMLKVSR